ncbi:MAG: hypothetical protein Fur0018_15460 [Anaerolineales bacterium]
MHTNENVTPPTFWNILWGIMRHPRQTFALLREYTSRAWLWMAALALVAVLLPTLASAPIGARLAREAMQQSIENMRQQNPKMTIEQENQMMNAATNPLFTSVIPAIVSVLGAILGWLVWSGALHLLSTMMGGGETFGQMWRVVIWSQLPLVLRGLLQGIYITLTGSLIANPGLSGLVMPVQDASEAVQTFTSATPSTGQVVLQSLLGKIDIFLLWNLALLGIGISVTARLSGRKAALLTVLVWLVLTALGLAPALMSSAMISSMGGGF